LADVDSDLGPPLLEHVSGHIGAVVVTLSGDRASYFSATQTVTQAH
jgi:hypothetical protein